MAKPAQSFFSNSAKQSIALESTLKKWILDQTRILGGVIKDLLESYFGIKFKLKDFYAK
ncbi:hypothetical protein [Helicobacter canis]|uniref:hypothetical protein n=1 Tax=Helicobacter canis TaxID=29419 RepID=UPI0015F083E4|nr:hypothetical protein [Helicobacter canis]